MHRQMKNLRLFFFISVEETKMKESAIDRNPYQVLSTKRCL